jgi:hypothetical protein
MTPSLIRGYQHLKKTASINAHVDAEKTEIVITLNKKPSSTRQDFVIDALEAAGSDGLFVNALLRGWNSFRDKIGKSRSNYATFRNLVWSMKKKGIIEWVPDGNVTPRKDRKGKEMFTPSFYRLTRKYLKYLNSIEAQYQ